MPVTLPAFLFALLMLTSGCTGIPDNVSPVSGFDVNRYLGTWYEIARLDHSFERGLEQVTAEYSLRCMVMSWVTLHDRPHTGLSLAEHSND